LKNLEADQGNPGGPAAGVGGGVRGEGGGPARHTLRLLGLRSAAEGIRAPHMPVAGALARNAQPEGQHRPFVTPSAPLPRRCTGRGSATTLRPQRSSRSMQAQQAGLSAGPDAPALGGWMGSPGGPAGVGSSLIPTRVVGSSESNIKNPRAGGDYPSR
jgi:hypothetical protein